MSEKQDKNNQSDEELMVLYQNGDSLAFERLYERHSGRVFQYLKTKVAHGGHAQDLLQEVFMKVHRSRAKYISEYPFLPWIFTIARNTAVDFLKSSQRRESTKITLESFELSNTPTFSAETTEQDLAHALGILPTEQKRAIELRYLNDWSFEKIAEEMKTTPVNSRQIISRGIKKIRSLMEGEHK
jgi:RNA polymerase sigma-70 factor (ECF subfamily)